MFYIRKIKLEIGRYKLLISYNEYIFNCNETINTFLSRYSSLKLKTIYFLINFIFYKLNIVK